MKTADQLTFLAQLSVMVLENFFFMSERAASTYSCTGENGAAYIDVTPDEPPQSDGMIPG